MLQFVPSNVDVRACNFTERIEKGLTMAFAEVRRRAQESTNFTVHVSRWRSRRRDRRGDSGRFSLSPTSSRWLHQALTQLFCLFLFKRLNPQPEDVAQSAFYTYASVLVASFISGPPTPSSVVAANQWRVNLKRVSVSSSRAKRTTVFHQCILFERKSRHAEALLAVVLLNEISSDGLQCTSRGRGFCSGGGKL